MGQGIQFIGSALDIHNDELNKYGTAKVKEDDLTYGKSLIGFVEKAPFEGRLQKFWPESLPEELREIRSDDPDKESKEKKLKKLAAEIRRLLENDIAFKLVTEVMQIPTNWADYFISREALADIRAKYKEATGVKGSRYIHLVYGLDTAGDLFEAATTAKEVYVGKKAAKWVKMMLRWFGRSRTG